MSDSPISTAEVEHLAQLARLKISAQDLPLLQADLSAILGHLERLASLDLEGVEPLAHPTDVVNRLDDDIPRDPLPLDALLMNAPDAEGPFLAVPKVISPDQGG